MISEKKRFHPIALISYIITSLRAFIIFIFLAFANMSSDPLWSILIVGGILVLSVISALIKYLTRKFSINEDKILVYSGVFIKKEREIPYERIQTIKQRQWFFYKPFNVVQILIETGSTSSEEAEASLLAVDSSLINIIEENRHRRLNERKTSNNAEQDNFETQRDFEFINDNHIDTNKYSYLDSTSAEEDYKAENQIIYEYRMSNIDILFYALTDLNVLLILLPIVFFIFEIITEFPEALDLIPQVLTSGLDSFLTQALWFIVIISIISSIGILLGISVIKNFLYYFDFKVTSSRKTITIEYGLFERKTQKIPLNKVQGIKTYQQLLRRVMGMSSVEIILIGGQESKGESVLEEKVLILPLIKTNLMHQALQEIFPNYHLDEPEINYVGRGKLFYFWRWILLFGIPLTIVSFYFVKWLGIILLILAIISLFFNWLDFRYQGYAIMGKNLIAVQNFSYFSKVQTFLDHSKIQAFKKHSSVFLLRKNIGHFMFSIKSGVSSMEVGLKFADEKHIDEIQSFFTKA